MSKFFGMVWKPITGPSGYVELVELLIEVVLRTKIVLAVFRQFDQHFFLIKLLGSVGSDGQRPQEGHHYTAVQIKEIFGT